jgi:hypothetical protein
MATTAAAQPLAWPSRVFFVSAFLSFILGAALLAGTAPIQISIWAVFLFAGPHNWMEARYLVSRLPARFGPLRIYFAVGFGGVLALAAGFWTLPWQGSIPSLWHSSLAVWTCALLILWRREQPAADWFGVLPITCLWLAAAWLAPAVLDVAIVYAHPLLAFWFLDRQIRCSRPEWLSAWRRCLLTIPILLVILGWRLSVAPPLEGFDPASWAVIQHTNTAILQGIPSRPLVGTHAFLETSHYAIWLLALPLLGLRGAPWRLENVPLVRHRLGWPRLIRGVLLAGAGAVALLWFCFWLDYAATRQIYFTIALVHVLAEIPFLVRFA